MNKRTQRWIIFAVVTAIFFSLMWTDEISDVTGLIGITLAVSVALGWEIQELSGGNISFDRSEGDDCE